MANDVADPSGPGAGGMPAGEFPPAQSRGVFVLGMHRSGTSATTRALNLLGLPLGRSPDLVTTRAGNLRGYWEPQSLITYNEKLLQESGCAWWCPPSRAELLRNFGAATPQALAQARQAFQSVHFSAQWAWKDPRLCLLLPFWQRALDIPVVAFLAIRHPAEIAASLRARNKMSHVWSLSLWECYMRQAMLDLSGSPVFVYRYADLLNDPGPGAGRRGPSCGSTDLRTSREARKRS